MLLLCNYYITYRCNAFCNFCHFANHSEFNNSEFAKVSDYERNLVELKKLGVKFLDITGGEPLLHKNIVQLVEIANNLNYQTSITTNCLLYPKYSKQLAGKIDLLHFSLDAPLAEDHNKIRGVDCFSKVLESLEIAKSLGEKPDLLFTVTNESYLKLAEMHKIALEYNVILIVNPVFSYFGNEGLSNSAIDYIERYCREQKNIYINPSFLKLRKLGGNDITDPLCKAVTRVIVISPHNEVVLPCYHLGNKRIFIEKDIRTIRESEVFNYYKRMEGRFDFCKGCTINCYFEPSFAFPTNTLSIFSLKSKLKYSYYKLIKQKIIS